MSETALAQFPTGDSSANIAAALLAAQKAVLDLIVQNQSLDDVLASLCRIVESQSTRTVRAAILLVTPDGKHLTTGAAPNLPASYSSAIDGIEIAANVGTCAAAAARREVVITADIAEDPAWCGLSHLPLDLGLKAAWSAPILSASGAVLGTFGTYFLQKRGPSPQERVLVEVLARTAALAIERQRAHEALQVSEARHRAIVEASPECVKLVSADGRLLQMNAAGLGMIEADSFATIAGFNIFEGVVPEHRALYREFHERVCQGEAAFITFDIMSLKGARRSMESSAVPLTVAGGEPCVLSISRDVTSRMASERALAVSHARLELAALGSGIGLWHCDLPFGELAWDARVREHFFIEPDARVTIQDFYDRLHPSDREPTRAAMEVAIANASRYDVIYRTLHPHSGEQKWIRALGRAFYASDGRPTHFDGVTVDVTAQKQDQQSLTELNNRLTEQDHRKDEFLATLAHELRNPLAPVRSGLHLLERGGNEEQLARVREMMARQLGHLVRLVDDLLDVSRITLGKIDLKMERIDFRTVLHSALEATRPSVEAGRHELTMRLAPDPFPLIADITRLTQVIANLISNSARYTPPGGRIEIAAETQADRLVVKVTDTGDGIAPDMLPRVFDLFTQAQPLSSGAQSGLGIGLTLSRRLTEMHGGTIAAASAGLGAGSTFTVSLPLATAVESSTLDTNNAASARSPPLRILVVDDNVDAAETLAMLLGLEGHKTCVAHTGEAALRSALEFQPNVVLLDIGLPGLSGNEIARRLRREERLPKPLLLIALTGWGSDEDRRKAKEAGFDRHLVKPVDLEKLLEAIAPRVASADE